MSGHISKARAATNAQHYSTGEKLRCGAARHKVKYSELGDAVPANAFPWERYERAYLDSEMPIVPHDDDDQEAWQQWREKTAKRQEWLKLYRECRYEGKHIPQRVVSGRVNVVDPGTPLYCKIERMKRKGCTIDEIYALTRKCCTREALYGVFRTMGLPIETTLDTACG